MTREYHPSRRTLASYVASTLTAARRRAVEAHLKTCERCRETSGIASSLLDEPAIREAIHSWVDYELESHGDHLWPSLVDNEPRLRHRMVAEYLVQHAIDSYSKNPVRGLAYVETAIAIYEYLPAAPPEERTEAWRYRAALLLRCGRLSDAEVALQHAYDIAAGSKHPEQQVALLDLARGIAYSEPDIGRFEEALKLLAMSRDVLAKHGDHIRAQRARVRMGDTYLVMGQYAEALGVFQRELVGAGAEVRPSIQWRVAWSYFESGDPAKAVESIEGVREAFEASGEAVPAAHCDWLLGASLSRLGRYDEAVPILEAAEQTFFALALSEAWVEVRLARVECHMAAGHEVNVRGLLFEAAETSIELDDREPSRRHHATADALAYLRKQAMHETVTSTMVEYVRDYVHQAQQRPVGRFTPPQGAQIM